MTSDEATAIKLIELHASALAALMREPEPGLFAWAAEAARHAQFLADWWCGKRVDDRTAEFAAQQGVPAADVTHCKKIGESRTGGSVYSVGWWAAGVYMTAVAVHDGAKFCRSRITYDSDVERTDSPLGRPPGTLAGAAGQRSKP